MNWLCPTTQRAADSLDGLGFIGPVLIQPATFLVGAAAGFLGGKKKKKKKKKTGAEQTVWGVPVSQISSRGPGGEAISSDPATRYAYLIRLRDAGWDYAVGEGWRSAAVPQVPAQPSPTGGYQLPGASPLTAVGPLSPPIPAKDLKSMLTIGIIGIIAVAVIPALLKRKG